MYENELQKIGLSPTEAKIYLTVLEYGRITPAILSKVTNIKRPTVYAAADELARKGLITINETQKTISYFAKPLSSLPNFINEQSKELAERKNIAELLAKDLAGVASQGKHFAVPKIQMIEAKDIEKFLYDITPVLEQSFVDSKESCWFGYQDHTFVEHEPFRKWIEWYWSRAKSDITLKLFSNDSEIERKVMKPKEILRRQIKFWDEEKVEATQWIVGNYVIYIVTRQKPWYAICIENRLIAKTNRELFKKLWSNT